MSSESTAQYKRIDPRDFVNPPFIACPKCGAKEFGILSIYDDGFSRRCRVCWFTAHGRLPAIRKSVLYLDQFAISNLMYADPQTAERCEHDKTVGPFWHDLFAQLRDLLSLQLAVCPQSSAHGHESALSRHHLSLKGTFEALSLGVSFYDFETIKRFQITESLHSWLQGQPYATNLDIRQLVHHDPHVWTDRFLITVNLGQVPGYIEALKAEREATHHALSGVFKGWKENPGISWDQWFEEEVGDYGPSILKAYVRDLVKFRELQQGVRAFSEDDAFPTSSQVLVAILLREIRDAGVADQDAFQKLVDFLNSPNLKAVPFNRIAASLYASVAKKAPHQNKLPTKGFFTDVDVISCLLPYCDAMFLDIECWTYLSELKRSGRLQYDAQVFSLRNKDQFSEYLENLRASAHPEHLEIVRQVYGV